MTTMVSVKRDKENNKETNWRNAALSMEAGQIVIESKGGLGKKWRVELTPDHMTIFEIDQISDTNTLAMMYGGGLLGYGVAALMGRWIKLPVIRLEQPTNEIGGRVLTLQGIGFQRRKATEKIARELETFLRERGFSSPMPDLNREELWKAPIVPMLAGCAILVVALILLFACIAIGANM